MNAVACAPRLELTALLGIPIVQPGDDLSSLCLEALERAQITLGDGDVVVVASKLVSRAEGRFVDLAKVTPSPRASELAFEIAKDARVVELVLRESTHVSRKTRGALVVRHNLGFVVANAGIDMSNAGAPRGAEGAGPWALLLPEDPDASAERIRASLGPKTGAKIGVVITDSHGRPFRLGTVGAAIGIAGVPALWDQRGQKDMLGRVLEQTVTALGDQIAAAADLVAGQGAERRGVVHMRGLAFDAGGSSARSLVRPADEDLYV